jgi:hypothetical protein
MTLAELQESKARQAIRAAFFARVTPAAVAHYALLAECVVVNGHRFPYHLHVYASGSGERPAYAWWAGGLEAVRERVMILAPDVIAEGFTWPPQVPTAAPSLANAWVGPTASPSAFYAAVRAAERGAP